MQRNPAESSNNEPYRQWHAHVYNGPEMQDNGPKVQQYIKEVCKREQVIAKEHKLKNKFKRKIKSKLRIT